MNTTFDAKEFFTYDNGNLFWKVNRRNKIKIGDRAGCLQNNGYEMIRVNGKLYLLHRVIFFYHYGYFPKFIDHIDGNKLNNKIENLRDVTKYQNAQNKGFTKNSSSKYKGVSWKQKNNKWQSYIRVNGKCLYLGLFENEKEAAIVYNKAAIKYFGKYSRLNEFSNK